MAALPQDLMEDILSRLPVKSLLRFKTASKRWYFFISQNHEFANFNLKQSSPSSNLLCFQIDGDGDIFQYSDIDSYESRKIKFPVEIARPCRIIGSANGLICVSPKFKRDWCYIWNPCTDECKRIPVPFSAGASKLFGFGHDSTFDDYKIIGVWDSSLHIFSLKRNSWRILEYPLDYAPEISPLHLNGALNWCAGRHITVFDLAMEKILFLDLPEAIKFVGSYESSWVPLFEFQGLLCASGSKSIWVMREYGNSQSWEKLTTSLPEQYAKQVCISRVGKLVFHAKGGVGFVKSDVQGRMLEEDKAYMMHHTDAFVYKESLISPNS